MNTKEISFSGALDILKKGGCVARSHWEDGYILLVPETSVTISDSDKYLSAFFPEGKILIQNAHIAMFYESHYSAPWIPSMDDLLCEDWMEVNS